LLGFCLCAPLSAAHAAATLSLQDFGGHDGLHISGVTDESWLGLPVAGVGDFNGDGIDDFLVAAEHAPGGGTQRGSTYLIYGRTSFPKDFDLASLDGSTGMRIDGEVNNITVEWSAAGAGDVNGDGYDDVVMGAPQSLSNWRGRGCVVFGRPNSPATLSLSQLNGFNGFCADGEVDYDDTGQIVAGIGDLNADGFDDVAIVSLNHVKTYIVFGHAPPFDPSFTLASDRKSVV
jgi:hypothetical protein